jgi:dethiobiotin synthetase
VSSGVFVTATDTEVGKTYVSAGLLAAWRRAGIAAAPMKPVASGARLTPAGLRNEDAEILIAQSSLEVRYETVNPYVFAPPIAPHLAAAEQNQTIKLATIVANYRELRDVSDAVVVEGVGGWRVPLAADLDLVDLVKALELPVLLVVGMRLGCINQARLSAEAIVSDGLELIGWVANEIDPAFSNLAENIASLEAFLPAPKLATFRWSGEAPSRDVEANHIAFATLAAALT